MRRQANTATSSTRVKSRTPFVLAAAAFMAMVSTDSTVHGQQRVLGLDVSAWQGNISQTTWNNIHNLENRDFVFIRSSRGAQPASTTRASRTTTTV